MTGLTRIQELGLDLGPRWPLRFVVEGDLHLAVEGVFLHRTKRLPPDAHGMATPAAAYLAYCRRARVIDAIKVGDWLLHRCHMRLRAPRFGPLWAEAFVRVTDLVGRRGPHRSA
ncbi:MAG: hypothetical protein ACXWDL_11635, partial [Nocardioides sp.]